MFVYREESEGDFGFMGSRGEASVSVLVYCLLVLQRQMARLNCSYG